MSGVHCVYYSGVVSYSFALQAMVTSYAAMLQSREEPRREKLWKHS